MIRAVRGKVSRAFRRLDGGEAVAPRVDEGVAARQCEGAGQIHGGAWAETDAMAGPRGTCAFGGHGPREDVRLQALEVGAGVESELVNEHRAGAAEGGQRVGLAARAVERAGKEPPGRLAPRVFGEVGTQFGDEVGPFPGVEEDAGAQFRPLQLQLLQSGPLALCP